MDGVSEPGTSEQVVDDGTVEDSPYALRDALGGSINSVEGFDGAQEFVQVHDEAIPVGSRYESLGDRRATMPLRSLDTADPAFVFLPYPEGTMCP